MPRFDNEGFNPNRRRNNDKRDRSVPSNENYYDQNPFGFDFNPRKVSDAEVVDNQEDFAPPLRSERQRSRDFRSEVEIDEAAERREYNAKRAQKRQAARDKKKAQQKKQIKAGIIAAVILLILIPILLVESVLGKITYDDKVENTHIAAAELKDEALVKNILLLGVDARPTDKTETSHPDSIMLISIDMKHRCIKMTSFLRDTWVYLASRDKKQRINTANQGVGYCGIVHSLEYLFGLDIDGYVVTDFQMFRRMVDSIGGVTINVTKAEAKEINSHKKRYGNVKIKSGERRLNGKQALAYSRIRKIDTDFKRAERQRTVINSILSEVKKNPFKLYKLANGAAPYLETDLSKGELNRIAALAMPCLGGDMPQQRVPFDGTWQYANIGGASVITIDEEANKEKLLDYIYNKSAKELKTEKEKE